MEDYSLASSAPLPGEQIAEHRYAIDTRGYTVVPRVLSHELVAGLRAALAAALDDYRPTPGCERSLLDRYLLHDLLARDIAFARLLEDPRLQQLLAPLLGEHWIMYAFTSSSLPPQGTNYGRRIHVDSPRQAPGFAFNVGLIWALDDFTADSGGTEALPGSHHVPVPDHGWLEAHFEAHCARVECAAGDLIVFHARLLHRSGENRTARWRHALTMNCCRSFMKPRMDWVRFVPRNIAARLNAQGRRLLGYDTRVPTSMQELFLPESERLYKPNQG